MPSPKSPQEMFQIMKGNIEEKTGQSFGAWVSLGKKSEITKFKALTSYLKDTHGLSYGYAQMVAWGVLDPARLEAGNHEQSFVEELYSGKKSNLKPIYEVLLSEGLKLGSDVEEVICKTYSSLRSKSQFAVIAPRTNSAVDLELSLPLGIAETDRLKAIKSSNPKITHRIRISSLNEIDKDVISALKTALENNRK